MSNITSIISPSEIYQANKVPVKTANEAETGNVSFQNMLSDAIGQADNLQAVSQEGTQALLSGEVDDIAKVMIDGTKAELSLNMVIQIRNKVLDAYNEVMRMSL
ncbi:flagellar hook-basal body complex protein FliE [Christensenella tenuis]|uniref:Flagellar hook-basal body complex protein FliE n=1 Tax=Christensenella tenuis TaxID=2763033 RepID=A0ABR7ECA1_9FIRM|nr:flagellar hook-basal body complex protein FliE [Christensenella tenuis]MBC5646744.1 flagellar hook-basal body complex protein FliE [Christensenella tenuis]